MRTASEPFDAITAFRQRMEESFSAIRADFAAGKSVSISEDLGGRLMVAVIPAKPCLECGAEFQPDDFNDYRDFCTPDHENAYWNRVSRRDTAGGRLMSEKIEAALTLANAGLPDGDPRKFTWDDVDTLRRASQFFDSAAAGRMLAEAQRVWALADRIEALLPPRIP